MSLDLFGRLVSWLKKILHICPRPKCEKYTLADVQAEIKPVELTQPSETPSIRAAQVQERPAELPLLEEKTIEATPLPEKGTSETLSEEEPVVATHSQEKQPQFSSETFEKQTISNVFQEQSREKLLTTEQSQESAETEEKIRQKKGKDRLELQKPYQRKIPIEERRQRRVIAIKRKPFSPKQRKPIDLGATQRKRRGLIKVQGKSQSDENVEKETNDKTSDEKEFTATVESPFVEIDLDNANVYLILPQQQFATNTLDKIPQQLSYRLDINGEQQEVFATITHRDGCVVVVKEKEYS